MFKQIAFSIGKYFPYIVGGMSLLNIIMVLATGRINNFSLLLSVVGLIAFGLSFNSKFDKFAKPLYYIWIGGQLLTIHMGSGVIDGSQGGFALNTGFFAGKGNKTASIQINWFVAFYVTLYRLYTLSKLAGARIMLYKLRREENILDGIMPTEATIIKLVQLGNDGEWLLIETDNKLQYDDAIINQFLIQRKDKDLIKPGSGNQVLYMRAVKNPLELIGNNAKNPDNFPPLDWAVCK